MTTDIAYQTQTAPIDHTLVLNGLRDFKNQDKTDVRGLWNLAKSALAAVRSLQKQLDQATSEIALKQSRIEELEQMATTDELTKLTNRRGFLDVFDREMDRTNREQTIGGLLIMIDMDNFKIINDTYGHSAGDEALKLVAQTLQAHIRKMDIAARLGGDEFVILFSNAQRVASVDRAQKLARKLNSLTLKFEGHRIPIRASLGIETYGKGDTIKSVFDKADASMYRAKERKKENA